MDYEIICPYCGEKIKDYWVFDYSTATDGDQEYYFHEKCNNEFLVTLDLIRQFTVEKVEKVEIKNGN